MDMDESARPPPLARMPPVALSRNEIRHQMQRITEWAGDEAAFVSPSLHAPTPPAVLAWVGDEAATHPPLISPARAHEQARDA